MLRCKEYIANSAIISWEKVAIEAQETRNLIMNMVRSRSILLGRAMAGRMKTSGVTLNELIAKKTAMFGPKVNFNGMGITVRDTWATHITIKSLHIENNQYRAVVHYKVQNHFGLDSDNILNKKFSQFHFFRIWFVLQRCNQFGFKPFMTNMEATVEITGGQGDFFTVIFWNFGDRYKETDGYDRLYFADMKPQINCIDKNSLMMVVYSKKQVCTFGWVVENIIYRKTVR